MFFVYVLKSAGANSNTIAYVSAAADLKTQATAWSNYILFKIKTLQYKTPSIARRGFARQLSINIIILFIGILHSQVEYSKL